MKIAKALKVKNRLAGELNRIKNLIQRDNSKPEYANPGFDRIKMEELAESFYKTKNELIKLKAKIQKKTAPIADKLIAIAEAKDEIEFFKSLDTRAGIEVVHTFGKESKNVLYHAFYTQGDVDQKLVEIQNQIDTLQDEIDEYNASTSI